jgi:hypothetical protein
VRYGLQFEDGSEEPEAGEQMAQRFTGRDRTNGAGRANLRSTAPKKPRVPRKTKAEKAAEKASDAPGAGPAAPARTEPPAPTPITQPRATAGAPKAAAGIDKAGDKPRQDNGGAQILSLDAFRKK